jgi:hypothetical protein
LRAETHLDALPAAVFQFRRLKSEKYAGNLEAVRYAAQKLSLSHLPEIPWTGVLNVSAELSRFCLKIVLKAKRQAN